MDSKSHVTYFMSLTSSASHFRDCWLLPLSTPTGTCYLEVMEPASMWASEFFCSADKVAEAFSSSSSKDRIKARCFEMLRSRPVRCQTIWHQAHSLIQLFTPQFHSSLLSFPTVWVSFRLWGMASTAMTTAPNRPAAKFFKSNEVVIKEERTKYATVKPICCQLVIHKLSFWNRLNLRKKWKTCISLYSHTPLSDYTVNPLPKRTRFLWCEQNKFWHQGSFADEEWVHLQAFSTFKHVHTHPHTHGHKGEPCGGRWQRAPTQTDSHCVGMEAQYNLRSSGKTLKDLSLILQWSRLTSLQSHFLGRLKFYDGVSASRSLAIMGV